MFLYGVEDGVMMEGAGTLEASPSELHETHGKVSHTPYITYINRTCLRLRHASCSVTVLSNCNIAS